MSKTSVYQASDVAKAWELIKNASTITLLTHRDPDADGASACAALDHIFTKQGKTIQTIYPTKANRPLLFQAENIQINTHTQIPELVIACDIANAERMYWPDAFKNIPLINIDHHISNSIKGTINFVDVSASSSCEQVHDLLKLWDEKVIDTHVANCLLYGILYDTQVFSNQGARPKTLRIGADLIDRGANLFQLKTELLSNKDVKTCALWGSMLSTITTSPSGKAAWVSITQNDLKKVDLTTSAVMGFSNFVSGLLNIDITLFFYENEQGKTEVSLRSKHADVNALAGKFGGGGHKNASGLSSDTPMPELIIEMTKGL